jgi:hypothetical protein
MTTNNQKQNLLPTGKENTGLTIYENSQKIIQKQIQGRINEIVGLQEAGLITAEELQLQIKNIMQEVSSKVSLFASLSHDEEINLKLARVFGTQEKIIKKMIEQDREDENKIKQGL